MMFALDHAPSKYVQIEQSTAKYGYIYGVFSRAVPRKKAEEFLSALDTVRFKYQKQDQQYIKVKDDYDALQEKVCILKADNDQLQEVKEELQQKGMLATYNTKKTCDACKLPVMFCQNTKYLENDFVKIMWIQSQQ